MESLWVEEIEYGTAKIVKASAVEERELYREGCPEICLSLCLNFSFYVCRIKSKKRDRELLTE